MQTKLKLHLEDLTVASFDTTATQKPKGTVFGEQCTCYTQCTCPGCPSCYESCDDTCALGCTGYSECGCPQSCPTVCADGPCCD
jgi:hypothetical protein